jgi:acyl transferase domain-containing protein/phosphopantetheinyl transferase (holo-ACP synthase)
MSTAGGVAIVGMACLFPGAEDLDAYWRNILDGVDATSEPPPEAWDPAVYYDPEFTDTDRTYCQRGGYLGSLARFDPLEHGIPPVAVGGEPDQWLALQVARDALADARQGELSAQVRERTAVVLGKGTYLNGGNAIAVQRMMVIGQTLELIRSLYPDSSEEQLERLRGELQGVLPELGPETVPGLIPNIIVGRIANRLDLMGPAYTVDAACASSLVAVQQTVRDLLAGDCDLAIAGGSQVWMPVATMNLFCRLGALSRRQQLRAFDRDADGTLLGEGIGAVVLKRAEDALRDGDRVYAVIRGVGVSSDGRGLSVMAPRVEGEELALRRAYEAAGLEPRTVELIEAHGTGTPVGDVVEIQALSRVFGEREEMLPRCAIGTVKTMIGHTIPAAGIAGLIKTALALHHRVLPPTLNCEEPNPELGLERTPFYINTEIRPWIHAPGAPRRAGVNAFGFGGINAHAVLEEWGQGEPAEPLEHAPPWDSEVFILEAESAPQLAQQARELAGAMGDGPQPALADLAYTLTRAVGEQAAPRRLAVVAGSVGELCEKLTQAATKLDDPACRRIKTTSGIYYEAEPLGPDAKIAFVFPGEGAQYPGMLAELCMRFPEARAAFDRIDGLYEGHPRGHLLSDWVFPRPSFSEEERARTEARLMELDIAVEAVLTANAAVHAVVRRLVGRCDALVGHSTGEHSAAMAAGALDLEADDRLAAFCHGLYASYADAAGRHEVPAAVLLAIGADAETALGIARRAGGELFLAMDNCPHQAVLVGDAGAGERARELAVAEGLMCEQLPYDRAVHTPLFAPFAEDLRATFSRLPVSSPRLPMWSCTTASPCPAVPEQMRELLVEHWTRPVRFRETIEALYGDGVRIFVEIGPRGNMTSFIEDILRGSPACAVAADVRRRSGTEQLNHLVARLAVHGVELDLGHLFSQRRPRELELLSGPGPRLRSAGAIAAGPGREPPAPAARLEVPLSIAWPMLRLSEQALERVRPAPDVPRAAAPAVAAPAHQDGPGAGEEPGDVASAVEAHLQTMQQFLETEREVMQAYLAGTPGIAGEGSSWPLLGTVVAHRPGSELVAQTVVDPQSEPYLLDHTLGRDVSHSDLGLHGLALMPLAMSIEMLAEAACSLLPGLVVRGLRDVRAHHWLDFGLEPRTLQVSAVRLADEDGVQRVRAQLGSLETDGGPPAVEAIVLLGAELPAAAPARLGPFAAEAPARLEPGRLYETMFHGPLWRGVRGLEAIAPDGVRALLAVPPREGLLRDDRAPRFALDPVLLDSAGQLVGFWAAEVLDRGRVVFPFALAALDLHAPPSPEGERLSASAAITLQGEQLTSSEIEVLDSGGRCVMRLEGWQDKRFEVPARFEPLIRPGPPGVISERWSAPLEPYPAGASLACRVLDARITADRSLWIDVWAARVLSRRERELFAGLTLPAQRRLEWLAARTAAKECVAELLADAHGLLLAHADVEILPDERGTPTVHVAELGGEGRPPLVSLSHTGGCATALAILGTEGIEGVGIDIELLPGPSPEWVRAAFSDTELQLVHGPQEDQEWLLRLWCAREAAAKALGTGITSGRPQPRARAIDAARGEVVVEIGERTLTASVRREGELIVASALAAIAVPAGEVRA